MVKVSMNIYREGDTVRINGMPFHISAVRDAIYKIDDEQLADSLYFLFKFLNDWPDDNVEYSYEKVVTKRVIHTERQREED